EEDDLELKEEIRKAREEDEPLYAAYRKEVEEEREDVHAENPPHIPHVHEPIYALAAQVDYDMRHSRGLEGRKEVFAREFCEGLKGRYGGGGVGVWWGRMVRGVVVGVGGGENGVGEEEEGREKEGNGKEENEDEGGVADMETRRRRGRLLSDVWRMCDWVSLP
ncbi:hypothetical protein HDV00_002036, partial [Rhizophlyctis rosea]